MPRKQGFQTPSRTGKKKPPKTSVVSAIIASLCCVLITVLGYLQFSTPLGSKVSFRGSGVDDASASFGPPMNHTTTTTTSSSSSSSQQRIYQLAYQQSLGFFDDIPDHQWKRAQEIHSKIFPNHFGNLRDFSSGVDNKHPAFKTTVARANMWNGANFHVEFHCPLAQRLPTNGQADGPKWVCDPHRLKEVPDCLVYSFGSNGKAEFEQGIHEEIGPHCEIHTFDPKKWNKRNGDFATALKGYATFHQWGLGTEEEQKNPGSNMKTLRRTMEELGHINRTIHIFKIDCEWCEWFTHKQWLEHDLRQILVETHNAPMPNAKDLFFDLHDAGYAIFSKEANYENGAGGVEFAFVKLSTDFFAGKLYKNL
jgi:hypothetical protein